MSVHVLPKSVDWRAQQADLLESKASVFDMGLDELEEWEAMLDPGDAAEHHAFRACAAILRLKRNDWVDQAAILRAELQETRMEAGLRRDG